MKPRTALIFKRCAFVAFVFAASQAIATAYLHYVDHGAGAATGLDLWQSTLAVGGFMLVTVFFFLFIAGSALVFFVLAVGQYVYNRIYRTPTL